MWKPNNTRYTVLLIIPFQESTQRVVTGILGQAMLCTKISNQGIEIEPVFHLSSREPGHRAVSTWETGTILLTDYCLDKFRGVFLFFNLS